MKTKIVFILTLLFVFVGCKTSKPIQEIPVRTVEKVTERLVQVELPADSAWLYALLECDSNNQVILKELAERKSNRVKSDFEFDQRRGRLIYRSQTDRDSASVNVKDSIVFKEIPIRVEVPKIEYRQTKFQLFLTWVGGLAILYLIIRIVIKMIR